MREVFGVLALLGTGLVAGVLFAVAISVVPALIAMPPARYVVTHKELGRRYDRIMPFIVAGSTIINSVFASQAGDARHRTLFLAAAMCMAAVAVVSQTGNVPINKRVKSLAPEDIGPDWDDPRRRWRAWHLLRTCCAIAGCALTATAVVLP